MSFIDDHIRTVHAHLDQSHVASLNSTAQPALRTAGPSQRVTQLQHLLSSISVISSAKPALSQRTQILNIINQSQHDRDAGVASQGPVQPLEEELEWLLLGKAAVQTYGLVLDGLLRQTEPINNELWYWGDVLSSYRNTGLYSVQTSPIRLWSWGLTVYRDMQEREDIVSQSWKSLYELARKVIHERSMADMQKRFASPFALIRTEIRKKCEDLHLGKSLSACGLGYLLRNTFNYDSFSDRTSSQSTPHSIRSREAQNWKVTTVKGVDLLKVVLSASVRSDLNDLAFEKDMESASGLSFPDQQQLDVATSLKRLEEVLDSLLPRFLTQCQQRFEASKRPGLLIRYWLPVTFLVFSSSTMLRILINRKEAIIQWINEFGVTIRDFWINWIVEPTKKVVGTIRHDESSEVSIMSKRSLEGDRESLERMVIDFAMDNPTSSLDEAQVADLRARVREGDLTPVLKAYEKDLHSPFWGTIRGNLIRALLIQVQKTKVDVEVAMGGIDSLLKSQELVFGFVGLTPGILVVFGIIRWVRQLSSDRQSFRSLEQQSQSYLTLRNIDRILTLPTSENEMLSFKAYGLLVCEASVLREYATKTLPKNVLRQFKEDFDDLLNGGFRIHQQQRVVDRIRWTYSRWF